MIHVGGNIEFNFLSFRGHQKYLCGDEIAICIEDLYTNISLFAKIIGRAYVIHNITQCSTLVLWGLII